ncbi:hypothetical protein ACFFOM_09950 [Microlunatus capsulatus]|uniref:Uncharacterized protein n=1 Tax=Microlunatus capsulatus TaxID=99117 RepID=A0ABS4ZB56_9ACTN|nr:hypothetical protein [Microlunatus capsulatus]MBP2417942.1 hypothetical protein [Microlunatus capsulatus]
MTLLRTAGALLLAGLAATACTAGGEPVSAPTPAPASSTPAADPSAPAGPSASPVPEARPVVRGGGGPDGLTVRYQDRNGSTKTLRVEDFPR